MTTKLKAVGYLRVSSSNQKEGDGFERQEDVINRYAEKYGVEILRVFKDDISGTTDEESRPAFQDMVSDLLKNGVRTVIVEGLDRLAREYRIQETLLIYLASKGITLINARTEENITEAVMTDPMRKALVQIQGVFAELEKNLLVKKLRVARERIREKKGKCEGRKSYAETDSELLAEIKRLRRKPRGGKRSTWDEIAHQLNESEFDSRTGRDFTGKNVQRIFTYETKGGTKL